MHRCCSDVQGHLNSNTDLECKKCKAEVSYATIPYNDPVDFNSEEIKKFRSFCHISNFIG